MIICFNQFHLNSGVSPAYGVLYPASTWRFHL